MIVLPLEFPQLAENAFVQLLDVHLLSHSKRKVCHNMVEHRFHLQHLLLVHLSHPLSIMMKKLLKLIHRRHPYNEKNWTPKVVQLRCHVKRLMTNDLFLEPNSHTSKIKSRLNTANKNVSVDQCTGQEIAVYSVFPCSLMCALSSVSTLNRNLLGVLLSDQRCKR